MDVSIETGAQWPEAVERLLRGLPEWFGIEQSILDYTVDARTLSSTTAVVDGEIVGVCLVRRHTAVAAEVHLLAVQRDFHRLGIGRRILDRVAGNARAEGVRLLEVKTVGPSGNSIEYDRTRAFYEGIGFLALEERTDIWGPENPCLILVKPLD